MHAAPIEPDRLLAHAGGLRALALQLLGDPHAAEDVLQDTFVRALAAPPRHQEQLGGWLAQIARGLALNRRRDHARRAERERRYAAERGPESSSEGDYDAGERGELLRALVEEVLALDEPYKSTLLQRWFEGRSAQEIAERTNTPLATVASRLSRGQAELRQRLERRWKDRRDGALHGCAGALAVLAGVPSSTSAPWPAAGGPIPDASANSAGALSAPSLKLVALGAAALVLGTLVVFLLTTTGGVDGELAQLRRESRAPEASASGAALSSDSNAPAQAPSTAAAGASDPREPLVTSVAASPAIDFGRGEHEFTLELVAVDSREHPLAAATILAAPPGHTLNDLGSTSWNGRFRRTWRGFAPTMELVVQARRDGYGESAMLRIPLVAGEPTRVTLPLVLREAPSALAVITHGASLTVEALRPDAGPPTFELDARGNGVFVEPILAAVRPEPVLADVPLVGALFEGQEVAQDLVVNYQIATQLSDQYVFERFQTDARVRGRVLDARGEPATHTPVSLVAERYAFGTGAETDAHGAFDFPAPTGPALIVAGSSGSGHAVRDLALDEGTTEVELRLEPTFAIQALLADERDQPLANWRVEAWHAGTCTFATAGRTRHDGRVYLAVPTRGPFDLLAFPLGSEAALPVPIARSVWAEADELALRVRGGQSLAELDIALSSVRTQELEASSIRVWSADRRWARELPRARAHELDPSLRELWLLRTVAPGDYVLELLAPPLGSSRSLSLVLRPDAPRGTGNRVGWDHAAQLAACPQLELRLTRPGARETSSVTVWRFDGAALVRSATFDCALPGTIVVPAGECVVELAGRAAVNESGERETAGESAEVVAESDAPAGSTTEGLGVKNAPARHAIVGGATHVLELEPLRTKR